MGFMLYYRHVDAPVWWLVCPTCGWCTSEPNCAVSACPECTRRLSSAYSGLAIVYGDTVEQVDNEMAVLAAAIGPRGWRRRLRRGD